MNTTKKLSLILLIIAIAVALWYAINLSKNQGNNKPAEVVNNATSSEPIVVATSTKDWLTYRNEEYGFEIQFPKEWFFKEFDNKATIFIDKTPFYYAEVEPPPLISINVQNKNDYKEIGEYRSVGDININNYSAEKKLYFSNMLNQDVYVIYIKKDNNIYIIQSLVDDAIFESLVNSFKFTK